jgi:hypothetical protein
MAAMTPLREAVARIDWSRPWFEPFRAHGMRWQRVLETHGVGAWLSTMTQDAQAASLCIGADLPLTFVAQHVLPPGTRYEAHIGATGCVPTRDNLHDFFNAASWFAFPRTKLATIACGMAEARRQVGAPVAGNGRGPVRDALAHFDENGAIFVTSDGSLAEALRAFDWRRLFIDHRHAWPACCAVYVYGHALLEKLLAPYRACTAHAWVCQVEPDWFDAPAAQRQADVDARVATALGDGHVSDGLLRQAPCVRAQKGETLTIARFSPLPVLGVPGWWTANADPRFYADTSVFRVGRRGPRHPC